MIHQEVKVVRLKSGEDLVAELTENEHGRITMVNPMVVEVVQDNKVGKNIVYMQPWLPVTILAQNQTEIYDTDILSIMHPSDEFTTYYINIANQFQFPLTQKEEDKELEREIVMMEMEEARENNQIH
jgi:hypothetical protein